jgi:hypothetical protein
MWWIFRQLIDFLGVGSLVTLVDFVLFGDSLDVQRRPVTVNLRVVCTLLEFFLFPKPLCLKGQGLTPFQFLPSILNKGWYVDLRFDLIIVGIVKSLRMESQVSS